MAHKLAAMKPIAEEPAKAPGLHMIVIGAGFPRSGTASCWLALQKLLKAPCYHMIEAIKHSGKHTRAWARQKPGKPLTKDVISILTPYRACTDVPAMLHWKQLLAANPQAKVLLTVRDNFEVWHESVMSTVYQMYRIGQQMPWYAFFTPTAKIRPVVAGHFFGPEGIFQGRFEDKEFARQVYESYIEDVKRTVPKDQLLVFNVKEGWEPLCKALQLPVPEEPFPQLNEREFFKTELVAKQRRMLWRLKYGVPIAMGAAATCAVMLARHLRKRQH